jgi:hypothetical protein
MGGRAAVSTVTNEGLISGTIKVSSSLHTVRTASEDRPSTYPMEMKTYGGVEVVTFPQDTYWTQCQIGLPPQTRSLFSGCPTRNLLNILNVILAPKGNRTQTTQPRD